MGEGPRGSGSKIGQKSVIWIAPYKSLLYAKKEQTESTVTKAFQKMMVTLSHSTANLSKSCRKSDRSDFWKCFFLWMLIDWDRDIVGQMKVEG